MTSQWVCDTLVGTYTSSRSLIELNSQEKMHVELRMFESCTHRLRYLIPLSLSVLIGMPASLVTAQSRYATSDNWSGYVHWIDLYDVDNNRIDPVDNPKPYSPEKTCGRCHDYKSIAHGWHFNSAVVGAKAAGRPGIPLIWSDPRTGTHLPLSYRGWKGTSSPEELGLTRWQISAQLGGYLPGLTAAQTPIPAIASSRQSTELASDSRESNPLSESTTSTGAVDRSHITGDLALDCMLCHHRPGSGYSPFTWTEQIGEQNFAYAPTAALGLAVVTGGMRRLKEDFDPKSENALEQLPKVNYEKSLFRSDGKVFIDLIRKPANESCYYCHTNVASSSVLGERWLHDQDVHLRAGMRCSDCHRNALDHQTVRGFALEEHPSGVQAASLSCVGCHLGNPSDASVLAGRMGAPQPAHRGLPPLHFEKLTCTACHSGTVLDSQVPRQLHSMTHKLGEHIKRTGLELPAIHGDVMLPVDEAGQRVANADQGRYAPHRLLWPSYWADRQSGLIRPLNPELAAEILRKPLRVRREFTEELSEVKLSPAQRKQILGDERASRQKMEELTQQQALIREAEETARKLQVNERILAGLAEIESKVTGAQAVLVSGGTGFVRGKDNQLTQLEPSELGTAADPYVWPTAHAVRPARQALGATGCQECHSQQSDFFFAQVQPVGVVPSQETRSFPIHELQQPDLRRLASWNQLFVGRPQFKVFGWLALVITGFVALVTWSINSNLPHHDDKSRGLLARGAYLALLLTILLLSSTSFGSILTIGRLQNYALLSHLATAGAFTFLLLVVAMNYLPRGQRGWWMERWSVRLLVIGGLVTAASMFLSMLPLLDTSGLRQAAAIHFWSGIVTACSAAVHAVSLVAGKKSQTDKT